MEQKELDQIIKLHEKWLVDNSDGKRADLSHGDLSDLDLSNTNLSGADFRSAFLSGTNFRGTNFSGADFSYADLSGANFNGADFSGANFNGTDLSYADFSYADFSGTDLSKAILNWVNWHETKGLTVYVAGLQSSRQNAQLAYIPSFDLATTGCWQSTWEATKKRVEDVYKRSNPKIYKKYQLAFQYIEAQIIEDKSEKIFKSFTMTEIISISLIVDFF